jgi:hypothetical protein
MGFAWLAEKAETFPWSSGKVENAFRHPHHCSISMHIFQPCSKTAFSCALDPQTEQANSINVQSVPQISTDFNGSRVTFCFILHFAMQGWFGRSH